MRSRAALAVLCAVGASGLVLAPGAASSVTTAGGTIQWISRDFGMGVDHSAGMALSPDGFTLYVGGTSGGGFRRASHRCP